ncbi:hypothetical protein [Williamsia sp. CHRR-6]|uniref:hypothetical protein n=1 Tax=Williamsia sp. CHRR-6 TaxID=2835871 RepID=UPI0035B06DE6
MGWQATPWSPTSQTPGHRGPSIPFIGLAEGYALAALRRSGVPLQRIRPALEQLDRKMGIAHALASEGLFTDGAEIIFDYSRTSTHPGSDHSAVITSRRTFGIGRRTQVVLLPRRRTVRDRRRTGG